jgi:DNA transposition AAA+ family ATPase
MLFEERIKEGEAARERVLVAKLRQFIEDSDLSFYKIASRVGTSGGILSMWLAGTARPRAEELVAIEKLLRG